jgi:hypothetical protein
VVVKVDYDHTWLTPVGKIANANNPIIKLSKTTEMRIE